MSALLQAAGEGEGTLAGGECHADRRGARSDRDGLPVEVVVAEGTPISVSAISAALEIAISAQAGNAAFSTKPTRRSTCSWVETTAIEAIEAVAILSVSSTSVRRITRYRVAQAPLSPRVLLV